jgi:hypothetical protein
MIFNPTTAQANTVRNDRITDLGTVYPKLRPRIHQFGEKVPLEQNRQMDFDTRPPFSL